MVRCFPCSRGHRIYLVVSDYSGAVVRAAVLDYAASQSSTCKPIDWILVYVVADSVRRGSGIVCATGESHSRESAFLVRAEDRSSGGNSHGKRGETAVNAFRHPYVLVALAAILASGCGVPPASRKRVRSSGAE